MRSSTLFGLGIDPSSDNNIMISKFITHLSDRFTAQPTLPLFRDNSSQICSEADTLTTEILSHGALTFFASTNLQTSLLGHDACAIAEVFRRWLMSLPEPLLSFSMYDSFILCETVPDLQDRSLVYRMLLSHLSRGFKSAARSLLSLLGLIVKQQPTTTLTNTTSNSLAILQQLGGILWPVFLRPQSVEFYMRDDEILAKRIVCSLISEGDSIWIPSPPTIKLISKQKPSNPSLPLPPFLIQQQNQQSNQQPQQQQTDSLKQQQQNESPNIISQCRPSKDCRPDSRQKLKLSAQRSRVNSGNLSTQNESPSPLLSSSTNVNPKNVQRTPSGDFRLETSSNSSSCPQSTLSFDSNVGDSFSELPPFDSASIVP